MSISRIDVKGIHQLFVFMASSPVQKIRKMTNSVDDHLTVKTDKSIQQLKDEVKADFNKISDDNTILYFKKLSKNASTPLRGSRHAAGFDLFSAEDKTIDGQGKGIVITDISIQLPIWTYGRVAPRSGLAAKNFIDVGAGVIDYDYRGNIGVVLFNHSQTKFEVKKGDRIAQLIIEKIAMPELIEKVELDDTERGSDGYGSTGTR